jgi:hypothetical protein
MRRAMTMTKRSKISSPSRSPENRATNRGGTPPKEYQFKPGQSGNPGGRPKKRPITERYALVADLPLPDAIRRQLKLEPGATWGDAAALGTFRSAVKGNWGASREIREALEGKSTQRVELTGESGGPVATKLDLGSTIAAIREFYGITGDRRPTPPNDSGLEAKQSDSTLSLPEKMAERPEPKKDRG